MGVGAEQRPPGFRWFVRLPARFLSWDEFSAGMRTPGWAEIVRRVRMQGGNAFRTRRSEAQVRGYLCFSEKTQCVPGTL